ncbi:bacterio-opsin activator [Halorubrum sp. Ib24]|uniref:PAS domain S-box protein n=1 Tax=Halorubrum sp. Ib24 TaxID=1383850 RepID=UPI000B982A5B|nr:PAS domain S-box protein [Halorubrum sp. Ib24]OYR40553.1 bacterio-opsin activator [Halorubrum sp. Ib24]
MSNVSQQYRIGVVGDAAIGSLLRSIDPDSFSVEVVSLSSSADTARLSGVDAVVVQQGLPSASWGSVIDRLADEISPLPVVAVTTDTGGVETAIRGGATAHVPRSLILSSPKVAAEWLKTIADRERADERRETEDDATTPELTQGEYRSRDYEQIFDGVNDAIVVFDPKNREFADVNESYHELLGYDDIETIRELGIDGLSVSAEGYTADRGWELIKEVAETDESVTVEWRGRTRIGEKVWLEATLAPAMIGGKPRVLSIQRDITQRKRREREYEQIFNGVNDAIAVHDPETGELCRVNETLCSITGYDRETLLERGAKGITVATESFDPKRIPRIIERVAEGDDVEPYEQAIETADGERRWLEVNPTSAVIDGEERFLAISRDITERRRRQRRLETERDRRSILFENTPDPIMTVEFVDGEPYITEVNSAFETDFGVNDETAADRPIADVVVPDSEREGYDAIRRQVIDGEPVETEVRRESADGVRDFLLRVLPFEVDGRRHAYVWYTDITERKRRERTIEEEREKYSTLVEQSTDGVVVVRDGEYVFVNEQFTAMTGREESALLGMPFQRVFTEGYRDLVRERYQRRVAGESPPDQYDLEVERPDGTRLTLETSVSRIQHEGSPATLATIRDVTERRQRERAVEQLQTATERLQGAETADAVYEIAVETASDVLDLPMAACWRLDDDRRRLEYAAGTKPVEEMPIGPDSFTRGDREYELFERGEATTYDPSRHRDHNPLTAAVLGRLGGRGLLAAGHGHRDEYASYFVDIMQVLAGHVTGALERVANSRQLRENQRRLEAIVDRIDETIFLAPAAELTEPEPAPDFVSSGYDQIWGRSLDELQKTHEEGFFGTIHPDDYDDYMAFVERVSGAVEQGDADQRYTREFRIERPDGERRWVRSDFYPTEWEDGPPRVVIVSRDVTQQKERERSLESFHDATAELTTAETVTEAGTVATEATATVFDMPATAVYHYGSSAGELDPIATGPKAPPPSELDSVTAADTAVWEVFVDETIRRVEAEAASVLHIDSDDTVLLVPLGGNGILAVWRADEAFDTEAASIVAATLEAALNRLHGERKLEDRREELAKQTERAEHLESITEVTSRVEAAITTRSSQEGIQEAVCEELVETGPFTAAWVATAEVGTDRLTPRAVVGTTREDVERALGGDRDRSDLHPARDAWQRGESRVVTDPAAGGRRSDWRRDLLRAGAGAVCAVPLAYDGITYGILTVIADETDAFGDRDRDILSQLGTSIGYAITAIERRRALESDDTLELEFQGSDMDLPFARLAREFECPVRLERTVRRQNESISVYYTLESDSPSKVAERADELLPGSVTVVSRGGGQTVLERRGSSWFGSPIPEYGGVLRHSRATPEVVKLIVELPREADTRTIVDRITDSFPALELTAQRQNRQTEATPGGIRSRLEDRLSERQYEALKTGHAMGYFNRPRDSSGEAVADALGITQPTVNKHIRLGERKVFDLLFGDTESG